MWKLHRYYLRELAINSAITFLVLFAVVMVSLVARGIEKSQGGGALDAALIMLFFALDAFPHLLTIAFLIATVLTFTRAAQDRELIAIRAAGVPPRAPMASALLLGIGLSVFGSLAIHYVMPDIHFRKYRVIADVLRSAFISLNLGGDRIKLRDSGYVMTYRRREASDFFECTIYCPPSRIMANMQSPILEVDHVSMPKPDSDNILIVLRGIRDPIGGMISTELPMRIPIQDIAEGGRRDERDDDLRSDQLLAEVLRGVHPRPTAAVYTLFRRCNFAIMPMLMAPIGFCIAELAQARGRVLALVLALVPLGMFYLGEVLGARLLLTTDSPWCAWMPVLLLALVGGPLLWRQLRR